MFKYHILIAARMTPVALQYIEQFFLVLLVSQLESQLLEKLLLVDLLVTARLALLAFFFDVGSKHADSLSSCFFEIEL